jgi:hypothetical protein
VEEEYELLEQSRVKKETNKNWIMLNKLKYTRNKSRLFSKQKYSPFRTNFIIGGTKFKSCEKLNT